jgi:hypothetical protein
LALHSRGNCRKRIKKDVEREDPPRECRSDKKNGERDDEEEVTHRKRRQAYSWIDW